MPERRRSVFLFCRQAQSIWLSLNYIPLIVKFERKKTEGHREKFIFYQRRFKFYLTKTTATRQGGGLIVGEASWKFPYKTKNSNRRSSLLERAGNEATHHLRLFIDKKLSDNLLKLFFLGLQCSIKTG
jgi:hypothetical protein